MTLPVKSEPDTLTHSLEKSTGFVRFVARGEARSAFAHRLAAFFPRKGMTVSRARAIVDCVMAEVQTSQLSGELAQRFIAFVMMLGQQAGLFLGKIPHPETGKSEVNLDAAKLFIDQLEMIREKTRGNLSQQESDILSGVLSDLQMIYVQVSQEAQVPPAASQAAPEAAAAEQSDASAASEEESKKKFSKTY